MHKHIRTFDAFDRLLVNRPVTPSTLAAILSTLLVVVLYSACVLIKVKSRDQAMGTLASYKFLMASDNRSLYFSSL